MTIAVAQRPSPPGTASWLSAWSRRLWRAAAPLFVFGALLIWTSAIRGPFRSVEGGDDAFYLEVAHLWTRGVLPYIGAFDIKPPGFFAILAGAEFLMDASFQTLKDVAIVFDAVAAAALYFIGRRMGSVGIGLFAALLYPLLSQFVTNNVAYAPLGAFTTLAFLAALSPLPIAKRAVLAGLAVGAAFTIKQTAAFEGIALLAIFLRAPEATPRRLSAGLAFGAAAAVAPFSFLVYFAAHGAAQIMIDDVVLNALRRPASATEGLSFLDGVLRSLVYLTKPIAPVFLLACVALLRRRAIVAMVPADAVGAISLWTVAAVLSVWAQRSLFPSYLAPALAPLLLLAGACLAFAAPELKRIPAPARLALAGLMTIATAMFNWNSGSDAPQEMRAIAIAAEAIKASGPSPDDKLFVVNRGAWLYLATDLAPPTAYIHPEHTLCDFPTAGPGRLAEALATRPRYIVVSDRARRVKYELAESWLLVDAALARSYRLLVHAAGAKDFYDVYEAVQAPPKL